MSVLPIKSTARAGLPERFAVYAGFSEKLDRALVEHGLSIHYNFKIGSTKDSQASVLRRLNFGSKERPGPYGGRDGWQLIGFWPNRRMINPAYPYDDANFKKWACGRFDSVLFQDLLDRKGRDIVRLAAVDIEALEPVFEDMRRKGVNDPLNEEIVKAVATYIRSVVDAELQSGLKHESAENV